MDQIDHDYVVLLQPTSPLRTAEDIDATIERCHQTEAPACVTVTETDEPPQWMCTLGEEHELEPVMHSDEAVTRRQEAPATYVLNGAVYAALTDWLREEKDFVTGSDPCARHARSAVGGRGHRVGFGVVRVSADGKGEGRATLLNRFVLCCVSSLSWAR
jgi:hypothetical protein